MNRMASTPFKRIGALASCACLLFFSVFCTGAGLYSRADGEEDMTWGPVNNVSMYEETTNPGGWRMADGNGNFIANDPAKFRYSERNGHYFGDIHDVDLYVGRMDFGRAGMEKVRVEGNTGLAAGTQNGWGVYVNVLLDGVMTNIGFVNVTGTGESDWEGTFLPNEAVLNAAGQELTGEHDVYLHGFGNQYVKSIQFGTTKTVPVNWTQTSTVTAYDAAHNPTGWSAADDAGQPVDSTGKFHMAAGGFLFFGDCDATNVYIGDIDFGQGLEKVRAAINTGLEAGTQNGWGLYINVLQNGKLENIGFVNATGTGDWEITFLNNEAELNDLGKSLRGVQKVYLRGYGNLHVSSVSFGTTQEVAIETVRWTQTSDVSAYNAETNPNGWSAANGDGSLVDNPGKFHTSASGFQFFGDCSDTDIFIGSIDFGARGLEKVRASINTELTPGAQNGWGLYINVLQDGAMQNIGYVKATGTGSWETYFLENEAELNDLGKSLRGVQKIYLRGFGNQHVKSVSFGTTAAEAEAVGADNVPVSQYDEAANPNGWRQVDGGTLLPVAAETISWNGLGTDRIFLGNLSGATMYCGTVDFGEGGYTGLRASITSGAAPGAFTGTVYVKVLTEAGTLEDIGNVAASGTGSWTDAFEDQYGALNARGSSLTGRQEIYLFVGPNDAVNLSAIGFTKAQAALPAGDIPASKYNPVTNTNGWRQVDVASGEPIEETITWNEADGRLYIGALDGKMLSCGLVDFGEGGFDQLYADIVAGGDATLYFKVRDDQGLLQDIGFVPVTADPDGWNGAFGLQGGDLNELGGSLTGVKELYVFASAAVNLRGVGFARPNEPAQAESVPVVPYDEFRNPNGWQQLDKETHQPLETPTVTWNAYGSGGWYIGSLDDVLLSCGEVDFGEGGFQYAAANVSSGNATGEEIGLITLYVEDEEGQLQAIASYRAQGTGDWTNAFEDQYGELNELGKSLTGTHKLYLAVEYGVNLSALKFAKTLPEEKNPYVVHHVTQYDAVNNPDGWRQVDAAGQPMDPEDITWSRDEYGNWLLMNIGEKYLYLGIVDFSEGGFTKLAVNLTSGATPGDYTGTAYFKVPDADGVLQDIGFVQGYGTSGNWEINVFEEFTGDFNGVGRSLTGKHPVYLFIGGAMNIRGVRFGTEKSLETPDDYTTGNPSIINHVNRYDAQTNPNGWTFVDGTTLQPIADPGAQNWLKDDLGNDILSSPGEMLLFCGRLDFGTGGFTKLAANVSSEFASDVYSGTLYLKVKMPDGALENIGHVVCHGTGSWYGDFEDQRGDLNELGMSLTGEQDIYLFVSGSQNIRGIRFGNAVSILEPDNYGVADRPEPDDTIGASDNEFADYNDEDLYVDYINPSRDDEEEPGGSSGGDTPTDPDDEGGADTGRGLPLGALALLALSAAGALALRRKKKDR